MVLRRSQQRSNFCLAFIILGLVALTKAQLEVGFYSDSCPSAELIINKAVKQAVTSTPGNAAILLRLQFHDCFVQGCDGSILLKHDDAERFATGNAGVLGFEIIQEAKDAVESLCPGIVSCSDIIALAARDAVMLAKGPFYQVPTGRRDGRVSTAKDAANLPEPQESFETLKSKFREQGLTEQDLVLLSAGAHTIGLTACFFVTPRLDARDPTINSTFFKVLRSRCPQGGDLGVKIPLDWDGEFVFDDHVFRNIRDGKAVIASDAVLYRHETTKDIIDAYLTGKSNFASDFAVAMIKLGQIKVKTGIDGEIRRVCNVTN